VIRWTFLKILVGFVMFAGQTTFPVAIPPRESTGHIIVLIKLKKNYLLF